MARNKVSKLMITISGVPQEWATEKILKKLEKNDDFVILADGTMTIPIRNITLAKEILKKRLGFFETKRKRTV